MDWFNTQRPHSRLDPLTPHEKYLATLPTLASPRKMKFVVRPELPTASAGSLQAPTAAADIHRRPQYARLSHVSGEHEKDADIHPAVRRALRFGPDEFAGWLLYDSAI